MNQNTIKQIAVAVLFGCVMYQGVSLTEDRRLRQAAEDRAIAAESAVRLASEYGQEAEQRALLAEQRAETLQRRLDAIERGVIIPAGTRKAVRELMQRGEVIAPADLSRGVVVQGRPETK